MGECAGQSKHCAIRQRIEIELKGRGPAAPTPCVAVSAEAGLYTASRVTPTGRWYGTALHFQCV